MIVWILFLLAELNFQYIYAHQQQYNKFIIVDGDVTNSSQCSTCVNNHCHCPSLHSALEIVTSNTFVNITSPRATLSVLANISNVYMIGIAGSNDTVVDCNNVGGVSFSNCNGIDIFGIIWSQCGNPKLHGAISFDHSYNISFSNCKFQSSNTYGIAVWSLPGEITISDTEFSYNNRSSNDGGGGLLIHQASDSKTLNMTLKLVRCFFKHNNIPLPPIYSGGINIIITGSSSVVTISIEDSEFVDNIGGAIYISACDVNSYCALQLKNTTVVDSPSYLDSAAVYYYVKDSHSASFNVTNSHLYNNVQIQSKTAQALVLMDNSLCKVGLNIQGFSENLSVNFSNMNFTGAQVTVAARKYSKSCVLKFDRSIYNYGSNLKIDAEESDGCKCSITNCYFSNNNINSAIIEIENIHNYYPETNPIIHISNTIISNNINKENIVHLSYNPRGDAGQGDVNLSSVLFTGNSAADSTLFLSNCEVHIHNKLNFNNNAGKRGAGIYFAYSHAILSDNADVEFINNVAALGGGAIYAEYPKSYYKPWVLFSQAGKSVTFINNVATDAGKSIYFSIPTNINIDDKNFYPDPNSVDSIIHIPRQFNYSGRNYRDEIATSPYNLILNPPAICTSEQCSDGGNYTVEGIMLGEELPFTAKMVDYFNNSAETSVFLVQCNNCEDHGLTGSTKYKSALIKDNPLHNITIVGKEVTNRNTTVFLRLSQVIGTVIGNIREIEVSVKIFLHPCGTGLKYDEQKQVCVCNSIPNLVECDAMNEIRIKKEYWYGQLDDDVVVGVCPNNYCNYPSCDITEDFCTLPSIEDDQCHSHRTGTACGSCDANYTLAFDLEDCIPTSNCHIWLTILIVLLVIMYWVLALVIILCITAFVKIPIITGYAYGIIYFYSVLNLFLSNNLVSNTMTKLITIFSGLVNLTPRFLGMLCFVQGLSGIDQQFIHYIHPLAILLLLYLISRIAKHSVKFTTILGRAGIVRATCLFILLSYTSIASTSLQILRPLIFTKSPGVHTSVYTYLSPDVQYFSGRHIFYAIIALLCTILVALGLPAFLLLQPYLQKSNKFNFVKILPLLDQFQQCYHLKYRSVAAFYMICRLLIFLIISLDTVPFSTRFLLLQVLCFIIAVIHAWLQPYKESKLNSLDQTILLIALMIVSLNVGIPFTSLDASEEVNDSTVAILALLPLVLFVGFLLASTTLGRKLWQKITCHNAVNHPRRNSASVRSALMCYFT